MDTCKMQYAVHNGTYVLKLRGDVRVPLCTTLEAFVEQHVLLDDQLRTVLIDLTETESIDSTALGLLAKIAVAMQAKQLGRPVIFCINPDIKRILSSMGFDQVFRILRSTAVQRDTLDELPMDAITVTDDEMTQRIIDAHRTLMSLNDNNEECFRNLVDALEHEQRQQRH